MIPPLPHDNALPGLWALLDNDAIVPMIEARLNGGGERIEITACQPKYVRYKPETSCLIQYELSIRSGNRQASTSAFIRLFVDDRAHSRAASPRFAHMRERLDQHGRQIHMRRVAYLPEVNGLLHVYPLDYDLRYLERASDAAHATGMFRKALKGYPNLAVAGEPELIRYKPERKALLRYRMRNGPVDVLYGKVYVDDRGEALAAQTQALIEAGIATPPVLIAIPKRHFVAHAEVEGVPLASLRGTAAYGDRMEPLAESLRHLQAVDMPGLHTHRLVDETAALGQTAGLLSQVTPRLAARLNSLNDDIAARLMSFDERLTTGHGDFYDDQALVSDRGLTIIDLDELRRGHPLLDAGNMLAHLTSGAARGDDVGAARHAFLADTLRHMPYTSAEIAVFEAAALLKLAPGPFRRLEPDWPEGIERILALAEMRLAEAGPRSGPPQSGAPVVDAALPQLATLQDPAAMPARLADALNGAHDCHSDEHCHSEERGIFEQTRPDGRNDPARMPALLHRIEIVRHKPGRRAILRYDLASGDQLYGKTFASGRGPKVYEIARAIGVTKAFGPNIGLPEPVAWLPDLKLLLQRPLSGVPIEGALLDGDRDVVIGVAFALHQFHTSGLDLGRTHDLVKELEPLAMRVGQVRDACPDLRELAQSCLRRIQAIDGARFAWRHRPVHRDFYHDQVLRDGDALAILDLDDAAMSEPLVDVANFRAHLMLLGAQRRRDVAALSVVGDAFVDQYRELAPGLDERLLEFLTATTLLRLAGIHVTRRNGPEVARSMIDAANHTLRTLELPVCVESVGAAPPT